MHCMVLHGRVLVRALRSAATSCLCGRVVRGCGCAVPSPVSPSYAHAYATRMPPHPRHMFTASFRPAVACVQLPPQYVLCPCCRVPATTWPVKAL